MSQDTHLATVRRQLDELRRRTGVRKGDELDHALIAVEGLAATMATMSTDAAALIAEGERTVGTVISAALTKAALWRVVVLPAVVGALVTASIVGLSTTTQAVVAQRMIQADRAADDRRFEELRTDLDRQRQAVEADRQQVEATLPSLLLQRADALTGAARDIVRQEAATPGLVDFIAHNGVAALRVAQRNGGSLCPRVLYQGPTRYCAYPTE